MPIAERNRQSRSSALRQLADHGLVGPAADAFDPHHLLGVMRPAFGEGVADEHPAEHVLRAIGVEEVEEVAGPHLVDRREQQVRLARNERVLLGLGPARVRRSDIIDRRQVLLIRPGDVDVGEVLPVVGRRLLDLRLLGPGDRDDVVLLDELLEAGELRAGAGDRARPAACWRSSSPCKPGWSGQPRSVSRLRPAASGWMRGRRVRSARARSIGTVTISVSASMRWNLSLPSAKLGFEAARWLSTQATVSCIALTALSVASLSACWSCGRADAFPCRHAVARIIMTKPPNADLA